MDSSSLAHCKWECQYHNVLMLSISVYNFSAKDLRRVDTLQRIASLSQGESRKELGSLGGRERWLSLQGRPAGGRSLGCPFPPEVTIISRLRKKAMWWTLNGYAAEPVELENFSRLTSGGRPSSLAEQMRRLFQ